MIRSGLTFAVCMLVAPLFAAGVFAQTKVSPTSLTVELADALHADWQATARASGRTERFKPVKKDGKPVMVAGDAEIAAYASAAGVPENLRSRLRRAESGQLEEDILALPNRLLGQNNRGENDASARVVMELIQGRVFAQGKLDAEFIEEASNVVHEQWMARNGSWAPPEQMLPFSQLTKVEADKDRAMVILGIKVYETANSRAD